MTRGTYTRDIYFIPTILYHNGDGIYTRLSIIVEAVKQEEIKNEN